MKLKTMKSLKESIFGDIDNIANNDTILIEQFLKDNYEIDGTYKIDGDVVDVKGDVEVKNKKIESLTNGLFRFGAVSGGFYCFDCSNLKSLKGAPEKVDGNFDCHDCKNLKTIICFADNPPYTNSRYRAAFPLQKNQ